MALLLRRPRLMLAVLCLTLWTPGLVTIPPLDRDESRFAEASRQMLESGNFVDIRFGKEARYKKPVGIYWLQAATTAVAGLGRHDRIWTYRLASLLGGVASSWILWSMARTMVPPAAALLGAALFASTLLLSAEATIATTDAVLLACIMAAQRALLSVYTAARDGAGSVPAERSVLLGWAALGLGILVKGPVAPAICGATAVALAAWDRDAGWLRDLQPLRGLLVLAAIVAPWAIAIALATHGQFFAEALGTDFAAKLAGGQETHGASPGYYLALATLTLWPVTLIALPGLRGGIARHEEAPVRFLLAWTVTVWVIFGATPTKLPHYILPAYPAIALLGALWVARTEATGRVAPAWRWMAVAQFVVGLGLIVGGLFFATSRYGSGISVALFGFAFAALLAGLAAGILLFRQHVFPAGAAAILSALLLYAGMTMFAAPRLNQIWVSARLATLMKQSSRPGDAAVALAGFDEPSLVFQLGSSTRLTNGQGAADVLARTGGLAGIEAHERTSFLTRLSALHAQATAIGEVSGLNYSRGRVVHVVVYRVQRAS